MFSFFTARWQHTLLILLSLFIIYSCKPSISVEPDNPVKSAPATVVGIDVTSRNVVVDTYKKEFSVPVPAIGWVGNLTTCQEGTSAKAFLDAQVNRINYFRAMAGIEGNIIVVDSLNRKAQKAALMMTVANTLSHKPPSTWKCYSNEGAQAAGRSNLAGNFGSAPDFISQYIEDAGANNTAVGHRRWILAPRTRSMGSGNVYNAEKRAAFNALWVIGDNYFQSTRYKTRTDYVCWPSAGYIPYQLVYPRWSFQLDGADFSQAQIGLKRNGVVLNATVVSRTENGYGDNTIVWETESINKPVADVTYDVTVTNVMIGNQTRSFTYKVIVIDPGL